MITVRFVHQNDQVIQRCQVIEIGLAQIFGKTPHLRHTFFPSFLAFRVEFRDVEDVYLDLIVGKQAAYRIIVVTGNHLWFIMHKFRYTSEYILFIGRVAKVTHKFLIQCQIRSKNEEVSDAFLQIKISNARSHQPCFSDACGYRKGKRGKIPLEIFA